MINALRLLLWSRATTSARNMSPGHRGLCGRKNCGVIRRPNHGGSGEWPQRGSDDALDARGARHASLWSNYLRVEYRCFCDVLSNSRYWRKLAVAKTVVVKGGKYDGAAPKGWTFAGTASRGSDCDSTWKHGAARVTGYMVNRQGC
jgi:hypothetical protein